MHCSKRVMQLASKMQPRFGTWCWVSQPWCGAGNVNVGVPLSIPHYCLARFAGFKNFQSKAAHSPKRFLEVTCILRFSRGHVFSVAQQWCGMPCCAVLPAGDCFARGLQTLQGPGRPDCKQQQGHHAQQHLCHFNHRAVPQQHQHTLQCYARKQHKQQQGGHSTGVTRNTQAVPAPAATAAATTPVADAASAAAVSKRPTTAAAAAAVVPCQLIFPAAAFTALHQRLWAVLWPSDQHQQQHCVWSATDSTWQLPC
jgi:hypothetical protein